MNATTGLSGNSRIHLLEDYYAEDKISYNTLFGTISTPGQTFTWRTKDINLQVDWGFTGLIGLSLWYDSHSSPIQFYADTINSADSNLSSGGLANEDFDLNNIGWKKSIFYEEKLLRATITGISPSTLPASSSPQLITINGANFKLPGDPNASSLIFYDPANIAYPRTPINVTTTSMQYYLTVQSATGTWKVKVVNGAVESLPFSFTVVSSSVQLTGLSISGPADIAENGNGQFTATAHFSDGSSSTVTSSTSWSENSSVTSISSSGLLAAGSVSSNTTVTVSASFTSGGITKSTSANTTIVNGDGGGGSQITDVIVNGTFEAGDAPWGTPYGDADVVNLSYPHNGSWYAYIGNKDNAAGTIAQFFPIPASATAATLKFYIDVVTSETTTTTKFDTLKVDLATASDEYVGTIAEFSNLDRADNINGTYVLKTYNIMSLLNAYKGQSLFLIFSGTTDGAKSTIFRIDDVSLEITTPKPIALTGLSISGPSSLLEGRGDAYYAKAIFSDGTTQTISPNSWSENSSVTTISSDGFLLAGSVSIDTPVTVTVSYTFNGITQQATKNVTIVDTNPPHTLSSLAISGPTSMNENSSGQFTATAIFSDGTSQLVTPSWSENSTATSISSGGLLTAGGVDSDTTVTVSASYTTGGITCSESQNVIVINKPSPPTLTSLAISGASSVNENSTTQYSATAFFSDGSSQAVAPTWSEDSVATTISIFGLFSAGEVMSDTSVTVSASYTIGGITKNAPKSVTVINTVLVDDVAATINSISPNPAPQETTVNFSGTGSDSSGHSITAYSWRSSLDGVIGTSASFSKDNLSVGSHNIYLKVQCSNGNWSSEVPWTGNPLAITSNCTYNLINGTNASFNASGGSGKADVTTSSASCNWTAASNAGWITITSGSSGTGTGTVSYSVSANPGADTRTGTMAIAGQTFTVTQYGVECTYSLSSTSKSFNSSGGNASVGVTASSGSCNWTATSNTDWIMVTSSSSGTGTGTVSYSVSANPGAETRTGTMAIAGKTFTVIQYGISTPIPTPTPTPTTATPKISGGAYHSMTLKSNGSVWTWGSNEYTHLGDGTNTNRSTPIQVSGLSGVSTVDSGGGHNLALKLDGTVWAWGGNWSGQLGDGSKTDRSTPVPVTGLSSIDVIDAGDSHSLALKSDGTVYVWGRNNYGQLGDGTTTDRNTPLQMTGLSNVKAVAGGWGHSLALKSDGTVWAWGYNNHGQLGDGTTTDRSTPIQVSSLSDIIAIACGDDHSLALKSDGTVWAWGNNGNGALGDETTTDRTTPVQISELSGIIGIAGGNNHTVALKSDGSVWVCGDYDWVHSEGGVGFGHRTSPVQFTEIRGIAAIAAGRHHLIALKPNGTVWTWGSNWHGELGDGTTIDRSTPVQVDINLGEMTMPPMVTTDLPSNIASNSATLNGTVNANGLNITAWFEYGTTSNSYPNKLSTQTVSGSSDTAVSIDISGLSAETTYYYRIVAQNSAGTTYGSEISFTTLTTTPIPTPTPAPTPTPLPCKVKKLDVEPKSLRLVRETSTQKTVTLTCKGGLPSENLPVKVKIVNGKKFVNISPAEAYTDRNGQATFTITAMNKTGGAIVRFNHKNLKNDVIVKVKKK